MKHVKWIVAIVVCVFLSSGLRADDEVEILSSGDGVLETDYGEATLYSLTDGLSNTAYSFSCIPNDIVFKAGKHYLLRRYSLTSSTQSEQTDPTSWELYGSVDGENWVLLQRQSRQMFGERQQERVFTLGETVTQQAFSYLKLTITGVKGGASCSLAEWKVFGTEKRMPKPPTDARLNPLSYNRVKISWRDYSEDEDGFEVQRTTNGEDYVTIAALPANTTNYYDEDVCPNTPYMYRVCALSGTSKTGYAISNPAVTPSFEPLTNLTVGRRFSASDRYDNSPSFERVANLFDADAGTKFLTYGMNTWIRLEFAEPYRVQQYAITTANDAPARDPRAWRLEASSDGEEWVVLDAREQQAFDARYQTRYYEMKNETAYPYYRLNVLENNGDRELTQLADWLLFADVPPESDLVPESPEGFEVEVRSFNSVKLSWLDVPDETGYRIERYAAGVLDTIYRLPANNTAWYPYALSPETGYEFRLYAVNGGNESLPAVAKVTTPRKEWVEEWDVDFYVPSEVSPVKMVKVRISDYSERVAFYAPKGEEGLVMSDVFIKSCTENWEYILKTYGDVVSDDRLHVICYPTDGGGGFASIGQHRDAFSKWRNIVYIAMGRDGFNTQEYAGFGYDVMSHELCHIIEGIGAGGIGISMFYTVWGDSKWAEIFQYDIFKGVGSPRAATWHAGNTEGENPGGTADFPTPGRVNYWYRDFFYPTYAQYGETRVLVNFWKLLGRHYKQKNGEFQGSPENPGGRGNLGELIHFWSGACGTDVKSYAVKAFGWNDRYEMWLQKAKADYPAVTYDEYFPLAEKNICQNGGQISSNRSSADDVRHLTDDKSSTVYSVLKDGDSTPLTVTYASSVPASVTAYTVLLGDKGYAPKSWTLYGSMDAGQWTPLDVQETPDFSRSASLTLPLDNGGIYRYYKWEMSFTRINQIRLAELQLWGEEYPSFPTDLRVRRMDSRTVSLDWSSLWNEVEHYEIQRAEGDGAFAHVADVSRYEQSYIDTPPATDRVYRYRVLVKHKNPAKADVHSSAVSVDMRGNGVERYEAGHRSFAELLKVLPSFPHNEVEVYTAAGVRVMGGKSVGYEWMNRMWHNLPAGIYVVRIRTEADALPVTGKIISAGRSR